MRSEKARLSSGLCLHARPGRPTALLGLLLKLLQGGGGADLALVQLLDDGIHLGGPGSPE
jgi:hypothetical protein